MQSPEQVPDEFAEATWKAQQVAKQREERDSRRLLPRHRPTLPNGYHTAADINRAAKRAARWHRRSMREAIPIRLAPAHLGEKMTMVVELSS